MPANEPTAAPSAPDVLEEISSSVDFSPVLAGISLSPTRKGRPPAIPFELDYVRDITDEDIKRFNALPPARLPPQNLTSLKNRHHQLAKLLAEGVQKVEASLITGYTLANIQILCADPAFSELLAFYEANKVDQFLDAQKKLAVLGTTAVELLQEKLENASPEEISVGALTDIIKTSYDRSVAPDKGRGGGAVGQSGATPVTLNVQFVAPPSAPEAPARVIDGEVVKALDLSSAKDLPDDFDDE